MVTKRRRGSLHGAASTSDSQSSPAPSLSQPAPANQLASAIRPPFDLFPAAALACTAGQGGGTQHMWYPLLPDKVAKGS